MRYWHFCRAKLKCRNREIDHNRNLISKFLSKEKSSEGCFYFWTTGTDRWQEIWQFKSLHVSLLRSLICSSKAWEDLRPSLRLHRGFREKHLDFDITNPIIKRAELVTFIHESRRRNDLVLFVDTSFGNSLLNMLASEFFDRSCDFSVWPLASLRIYE